MAGATRRRAVGAVRHQYNLAKLGLPEVPPLGSYHNLRAQRGLPARTRTRRSKGRLYWLHVILPSSRPAPLLCLTARDAWQLARAFRPALRRCFPGSERVRQLLAQLLELAGQRSRAPFERLKAAALLHTALSRKSRTHTIAFCGPWNWWLASRNAEEIRPVSAIVSLRPSFARLALAACVSLFSARLAAAEDVRIEGTVVDAFTAAPVAGARISAPGREVRSDAQGGFALSLPAGPAALVIEAPGYLTERASVDTSGGKRPTLEVLLLSAKRLEEQVEVTAPALTDTAAPAELPVRPAVVMTVAGAAENVFRTLQTLPGVAATNEFDSRLSVRGGGPDQNLTVMDGIEIHNPYRLFGLTSAFNPEIVDSFELYTGAFGARYGDRLSSLLVVENRAGTREKAFGGSAALSITDANVVAEGRLPGGAKGSWLVTGRRTYYDLVANKIVDTELPSFGDLQGKAVWQLAPGRRLTLTGLLSREKADSSFEGDRAGEQGTFASDANNDLISLAFDSTYGTRATSRTVLSWYRNPQVFGVGAVFRAENRRSNHPEDDIAFPNANVDFVYDVNVRDLALRHEMATRLGSSHLLEIGGEAHGLQTRTAWTIRGDRNTAEGNGSSIQVGASLPSDLDSSVDSTRFGLFIQDTWKAASRLSLDGGLRLDYAGANKRWALSPRVSLVWALGDATRLRAGTGVFTQSPGYEKLLQADYFVDLTAGSVNLDHERSFHAILSLERDLGAGLVGRVEGYYKGFDRLIAGRLETEEERLARTARYVFPADIAWSIPTDPQITTNPENLASGSGYGFDLYLARRATSPTTRLTGWASWTWGIADRDAYGLTLPFDYDRRNAFTLVGAYRPSSRWEIAFTGRASTGFPRTAPLGLRVNAIEDPLSADPVKPLIPERDSLGNYVYTPDLGPVSNLNQTKLPTFARLDLRVTWKPRGATGRWLFYLDLINVTNRKNAGAINGTLEHDPGSEMPKLVEERTASIPFLPSFGVKFRF